MTTDRGSRSEIARQGGIAAAASLGPKGRNKRARKAAKVSAKKRSAATRERDRLIVAAYRHLTSEPMKKEESVEAISFLTECGLGVNLPRESMGPYLFLARATGLTKQRVWAIVRKSIAKIS